MRALSGGGERFAAYVAHELRTPLATQRALLELALADPNADVASWREIGEDVLGACRQQERLLEACLTLARSQGRPQRCEPVDLAAIAAEALRAHDLCGLERVVVLEPAWTTGDPDLLERLAANLVSNAIRHNIVGGRIEVATRTAVGTRPPLRRQHRPARPGRRSSSASSSPSSDSAQVDAPPATASGSASPSCKRSPTHTTPPSPHRPDPGGGLGIDVAFPALD